jgi:hypothetical protein
VNVLYNAADVGYLSAKARVGLCAKEHSSVGRAVVVSEVTGHTDNVRPDVVESFRAIVTTLSIPVDRMVGVGSLVSSRAVADELINLRRNPQVVDKLAACGLYHSKSSWSGPCADIASILEFNAPSRTLES